MQDKEALQSQVCAQLKLVSSLRAQVEDLSLGLDQQVTSEVVALRQKLEEEKEASSRREKEVRGKTEWERNICNCGAWWLSDRIWCLPSGGSQVRIQL